MKILIVDDNIDDRRLLKYIIEKKGHEPIEAGDGLEGLRMAKLHRPDLIISDALMPFMDGFQFLRQIKEDETLRSIPFLFYSATYKANKDIDLAIALGAEAYIIKPKEPSELWEEVELILQNMKKEKTITPELIEEDEEYLRRYSQVVAAKLEQKVRELEDALALRKKAEESLRQQKEFLAKTIESLTHPFYVINADDYTIVMSNSASHLDGLPGKKTCYALTHRSDEPCSSEEHACPLKLTKETKKPVTVEHTHYDEDGNARLCEVHGYPILDDDGNVVQMIEYSLDITERKKAEDELRQSEAVYVDLYDNSPDMYVSVDVEAHILQCNQTLADKLGCTKEEIVGSLIFDLYHPDCMEGAKKAFQSFVETGEVHDAELQLKRKDGSKIDVSLNVSSVRDENGKILYSRSCWTDITERKKAEEELKQKRGELDQFFNVTLDLLCIADTDGNFRRLNQAWEKTLGYSREELMSRKFLDFIHPDDLAGTLDAVATLASQREVVNFVNRYRCKDGTYRWIEWRSAPSGNLIYAAAHDITVGRQAEAELKGRVEELERFYDMAVGRELRMKELKKEIEKLKNELSMYKKGA